MRLGWGCSWPARAALLLLALLLLGTRLPDSVKDRAACGEPDRVVPMAVAGRPWLHPVQVTRPALNCLAQEDPALVAAVQQLYLTPPTGRPYNFSLPLDQLNYFSDAGQADDIDDMFGTKRNIYNMDSLKFLLVPKI